MLTCALNRSSMSKLPSKASATGSSPGILLASAAAILLSASAARADSIWPSTVAAFGPSGWWRLNETSGSAAFDSSGGGFDGTYDGSPTLGQAPAFDADASPPNRSVRFTPGTSDRVRMGDVLDLGTSDFTLAAWFQKTSSSTALMKILNKGLTSAGTPPSAGYQLRIGNNLIEVGVNDGTSFINAQASEPTINQWHFVAGVLDRSANELRLYVDPSGGAATTTEPIPGTFGSVDSNIPLAIGALDRGTFGPTTEFFDGFIDEAIIFERALTGDEVQRLFDSTTIAIPEPATSLLWGIGGVWLVARRRERRS